MRFKKNYNRFLQDVLVLVALSILSFYVPVIASASALVYLGIRVMKSLPEESLYIILLLAANTNIFFLFGAPVCNLLIVCGLLRLLLNKKLKYNYVCGMGLLLCGYELLHIVLYQVFNVFQCVIWCATIFYVSIYLSTYKARYDNRKAKQYFFAGVVISMIYGCYYRIFSNQGFSVDSFNVNDRARFGGGFYDPNYFAMVCLIIFAFMIGYVTRNKKNETRTRFDKIKRIFLPLILLALLFFCVAGLSKMFALMMVVMVLLTIPVIIGFSKTSRKMAITLVAVVALIYLVIQVSDYNFMGIVEKIIKRFAGATSFDELTTGRSGLINGAFEFLLDHPAAMLFGVGVQSYGARLGGTGGYLHSFPMEIITACGIIGSLIFVGWLIALYNDANNFYRKYGTITLKKKYIQFIPIVIFGVCICALNVIEVEIFYAIILMLILNVNGREPRHTRRGDANEYS